MPITPLLDKIKYPADLRELPVAQIKDLAKSLIWATGSSRKSAGYLILSKSGVMGI